MWFRVDDGFIGHPKVTYAAELLTKGKGDRKRGRGRIVAVWLEAGLHCSKYGTDGFVATRELEHFLTDADPAAVMDACVTARLLTHEQDGYRVHNWDVYQPLAEPAKDRQAIDAKRKQLSHFKALLADVRNRDMGRCRRCGRLVDFRNRAGAEGGTYDFADPQQPIGLANVFVCCRDCLNRHDSAVSDSSRLLPPGSAADAQNMIEGVFASSQRLLPETCPAGLDICPTDLAPGQVGVSPGVNSGTLETWPSRARDHARDPVPSRPVPEIRKEQESSAPPRALLPPKGGTTRTPAMARMRLSVWEVRPHLLAAVHALIASGAPYVDADGQPVHVELFEQLKLIAARDLQAEWEGRELHAILDAALGRRASLIEAEVAAEGFRRRERETIKKLGSMR